MAMSITHIALGYYSCFNRFKPYGGREVGVMDDFGNLVCVALVPSVVFYFAND